MSYRVNDIDPQIDSTLGRVWVVWLGDPEFSGHVVPMNDEDVHQLYGRGCKCNPTVHDIGIGVMVHNSFNHREAHENRIQ